MKEKDSSHNKTLGFNAESIARKWYERRGWLLENQNSRTRNSELDLVMTKKDKQSSVYSESFGEIYRLEYLFVEVKSLEIGQCVNKNNLKAEDNFTKSKQRMFRRGIEQYLMKNKINPDKIRTDLACVYHNTDKLGREG